MASGTAFWAAGKDIVASVTPSTPLTPTTPAPAVADAPPTGASDHSTQQSKGLLSNTKTKDHRPDGVQNGNWVVLTAPVNQTTLVYKAAPVTKRTCWADEVEDDETFLNQFATQPTQAEVTRLDIENCVKQENIKELEEILATKTLRIAELEGAIEERDAYIDDLEHDIKKKDNAIEALKQKNHEQYVEIQELHCEVSEKDDHIKRTEAKLERVPATKDIKSPIPHSGSSTTSDDTKGKYKEEAVYMLSLLTWLF